MLREEPEKQAKHPIRAGVVRSVFVLLTLALALSVVSFALGQRNHRELSDSTLAFPHPALAQRQSKNQQVQTVAQSATDRHQAPLSKQQNLHPVLPVQGVPSGIDCDAAPGIVIHDDGTAENGYGGAPGLVIAWADKFTPATYPATYTSVCLAFSRLCLGPTSSPVEIVVYDDDGPGGGPGTELGSMPVTITNIPLFPNPTPEWNSFDISSLNIVVNDGSVYIGPRWTPGGQFQWQFYLDADENGPGFGDGYWFDAINNVWAPIQNVFPLYRAMFVRAVEQSGGSTAAGTHAEAKGAISTQRTGPVPKVREPVQPETVQGCPQYVITQGTDTIVPGDTNIGNNCDECDTFVPLPFNFQLYGTTYTGVNVSSNGRLDFVNANEPGGFITACLPSPPSYFTGLPYDNTIFGLWQDQVTAGAPGCASFPGGACGIFTSVTGSAPNRIFNIEWRTVLHSDDSAPQNFEVRLYENDPNQRFDIILGTLTPPFFAERQWVSGVQGNENQGLYTEDFCICPPDSPPQNQSRTYTLTPCATPTATPTPTATATPTPRPTPTPRGTPVPRVRPTPHPRP